MNAWQDLSVNELHILHNANWALSHGLSKQTFTSQQDAAWCHGPVRLVKIPLQWGQAALFSLHPDQVCSDRFRCMLRTAEILQFDHFDCEPECDLTSLCQTPNQYLLIQSALEDLSSWNLLLPVQSSSLSPS